MRRIRSGGLQGLVWLGFLGLIAACGSQNMGDTPFDLNKLPKQNNSFSGTPAYPSSGRYCTKDASGNFVSAKEVLAHVGEENGTWLAQGGGCVQRPLKEVWGVLQNSSSLQFQEADLEGFRRLDSQNVPFLFESDYSAGPFFDRQDWAMEWYHSLLDGDLKTPVHVEIQYKKVRGTKYIEDWEGVIDLQALSPNTVSFAMDNTIRGSHIDAEKAGGAVTQIYSACQNLKPDWQYLGNP